MNRRARNIVSAVISFVVISAAIAIASQAEGREASRATSNDGGAWLVDRSNGGVAHIEATTRQPTLDVQVADGGSVISALQAEGVIAVHNRSANAVSRIDAVNGLALPPTPIPAGAEVRARQQGLVVFDDQTSRAWSIDLSRFDQFDATTSTPVVAGSEPGRVVVDPAGELAVVGDERILWPPQEEGGEATEIPLPAGFEPASITMVDGRVILASETRWLWADRDSLNEVDFETTSPFGKLQQESMTWPLVGMITTDGGGVVVDVVRGDRIEVGGTEEQRANGGPILFDDCLHSLGGEDNAMRSVKACLDGRVQVENLAISAESELRLVNGRVWIDALDGSGWLWSPDLELEEIADFSEIFENSEGEESADGDNLEEQLDQNAEDAGLIDADELDNDEQNEPPLAEDDEAATRVGRPVVVDVLANDTDPDGDVILIESAEILDGDGLARLEQPTSRGVLQVVPIGGEGEVTVRYQISDGNPGGTDSAVATIAIKPLSDVGNQPPKPGFDRVRGAAGSVVSVNLLDNDTDPDGDSLVLEGLVDTGAVSVLSEHPGGDVLLALPSNVDDAEIEIGYVVADEWQATSEGTLQITVRLDDTNTDPDARNDAGTTQVGKRITLDLLANDVDGDGQQLAVGQLPQLVGDGDPGFVSATEDGEFVFQPTSAGTFVFEYAATDGFGSDRAQIRIDVTEPEDNRDPIAVRDDATLAWGETRLVRVVENDGDPDGDLFGIVDYTQADNLELVVDQGAGFRVTMKPGAAPVETFQYRVSDGELFSELATVVINRSEASFQNAPPVANEDSARVRAGRTSRLLVLRNDYDPEGGSLAITEATSADGVATAVASSGQWIEVTLEPEARSQFTVQYTVSDEEGNIAASSARVAIVAEDDDNSPPIARADVAYTIEGEPVAIPVLANDTDPESDALSLVSAPEAPIGGSLAIAEDGAGFIYTPAPGFRGTDSFTYLVQDSQGGQATGPVRVGVMAKPQQNRPPVAAPDLDWTYEAGGGRVTLPVLSNDSDPDGDDVTVIDATGGAIVPSSGNAVLFDLPEEATDDQIFGFDYTIADGRGGTDSATVEFTVSANVDPLPPEANPDTAGPLRAGEEITISPLANDRDPDGDDALLQITSVGDGATIAGQQLVIIAPEASAEVPYTITDEQGLTASSFVAVTVEENLPPEFSNPIDLGQFASDDVIPPVNLADYVADPEGDELVFSGVSGQVGGSTTLDEAQRDQRLVTFLPDATFAGTAGFAFNVDDGNGNLVSGRVVLTLAGPSNRPPVGTDQTVTLEAGVPQPVDFTGLFVDPDPDDALRFEVVSQPANPVITEVNGTTATLSAPFEAGGERTTLVVRATDQGDEQAEATVTITVDPSSVEPPVANPDQAETNQEQAVTVDVLANDRSNIPNDNTRTLEAAVAVGGAGAVSTAGPNVTFTPALGFFGEAQIRYTVADIRGSNGGQSEGVLTVNVIGRPDPVVIQTAEPVGPTGVDLTWLVPADNGGAIEGYRIRVNGSELRDVPSNSPRFTFNDRVPGTDYNFEVQAYNQAGDGEFGASVGPITPDEVPGPPGRPTAAFVDGQPDALQVTWSEGSNDGSAIQQYLLEISQCASQKISVGLNTDYLWTGLAPGTTCRFRVSAENLAGESVASALSDAECPVGPPEVPGRPTAVRGDKEATVTWAAPASPDCQPMSGYQLIRYRNGAEDGRTTVPFGTNQWTSAPLLNGDTYTFAVRAENRAGYGQSSLESAGVIPCGTPLAPSAPTAAAGNGQITVTHPNDAGANGCAITQYQVRINPGGIQALPANGVLGGLTNGTSYTVSIAGVNEIGVGEFSPFSAAAIPFGLPGLPTVVSVQSGSNYVWDVGGADPNGRPVTGYTLSGSSTSTSLGAAGGQVPCINSLGNTCQAPSGNVQAPPTGCRQQAGTVTLRARATNEAGTGAEGQASRSLSGCPSAPTLSITTGYRQFTANWGRPSGTDAIYLQVNSSYGSPRGGSSATVGGSDGQSFSVTAWACNEFGCSRSSTRSVTLPRPTVVISWNPNTTGGTGCSSGLCRRFDYSWSNFAPSQTLQATCHSSGGQFWSFNVNTGSGSGSGTTPCFIRPGFQSPAYLIIGGVESNRLG